MCVCLCVCVCVCVCVRVCAVTFMCSSMIYFSEWGTIPRISSLIISRGGENTNYPKAIISSNVTWPNALTLSRDETTIYFGDASQDYLASYNPLTKVTSPIGSTPHIFGIDQYNDVNGKQYLYWSDWQLGVLKQSVSGGKVTQLASTSEVYRASGIKVFSRRSSINDVVNQLT